MNINIFKNLHTNLCKPIGSEKTLFGGWQHQALTGEVGSISPTPYLFMVVKPTTVTLN
jgi:hypothetical protein